MSDEAPNDNAGRPESPPEEDLRLRFQHPEAWRVLSVGPGLLVAIRRGKGILAEVPHLELSQPALAGDLAEIPASDLLSLLHQSRRTGIQCRSAACSAPLESRKNDRRPVRPYCSGVAASSYFAGAPNVLAPTIT